MTTCMVIDESDIIMSFAAEVLGDLGVEARKVGDPDAAIKTCAETPPDVILLDWDMPALGAMQVMKGVAALEADKRPTLVLTATENDLHEMAIARAAGVADVIFKPFDAFQMSEAFCALGLAAPEPAQADRKSRAKAADKPVAPARQRAPVKKAAS